MRVSIMMPIRHAQARYRSRRIRPAGLAEMAREVAGLAGLAGWVAVWIHTARLLLGGSGAV